MMQRFTRFLMRVLTFKGGSERVKSLIGAAAMVASILIASGFVYVLVSAPPPLYGRQAIFPSLTGQTIAEFVVISVGYAMTTAGIYVLHLNLTGRLGGRGAGIAVASVSMILLGIAVVLLSFLQKTAG
ncbi:MAG: hypothetical protein RMJ75_04785 [Nitrososphaerota archaeon]|nr:hypothetical protein [Nitrososphaerota archaeon]